MKLNPPRHCPNCAQPTTATHICHIAPTPQIAPTPKPPDQHPNQKPPNT